MENISQTLMDVNKYLIAILPPEPIAAEIHSLKEYARDKYNSKAALNSPAHITLHMPFEWRADKETQLLADINRFPVKSFEIELKDFGCFEPRVIFVDIRKNPELEECQRRIVHHCRTELNLFNADYQDRGFHPHITIAFRDLKKPQFHEAWAEFKNRKYTASFTCNRASLLKHDGKFWREIFLR